MKEETLLMGNHHGASDARKLHLLRELYSEQFTLLSEYGRTFPEFKPVHSFTEEAPGTFHELSQMYNLICWQLEQYRNRCGRVASDPERFTKEQIHQAMEQYSETGDIIPMRAF